MALTITEIPDFTASNIISASDFSDRFEQIVAYLNGGIVAGDFDTSAPWVTPDLVRPGKFYGSPARRVVMASADLHTRLVPAEDVLSFLVAEESLGGKWVAVPGLSATFYVDPYEQHTVDGVLTVDAQWSCFEEGGTLPASPISNVENTKAATYSLFIDGTRYPVTDRILYASTTAQVQMAWKTHNISFHHTDLAIGEHTVSIRVNVEQESSVSARQWNRIWTHARGFVAEVEYL
jgi:hypothetical protein